ncbi:recombinase family protein [Peribacillus kribbensis]|uniref:recombinase family protein n=1 Tax=Peribacillus kribbensis TaxID=356658 RepID=UPI00040833AA|nr:recombinase family protein [Peribacillus kribbensis]
MERTIAKVAVYVRKSREDETDETLNRQQAVLLEMCDRNGWQYELFKEVGSSQDLERRELQNMLEKIKAFHFDGVVAADLDRLSRNVVHFGQIKETLISGGCLAITPNKIYDFAKQEDDLFSDLQSVLAKNEYHTIKTRLLRGIRQSAKSGNWVGKKAPAGYAYNRGTKRLVPNEDAPVIKRLFMEYVNGLSTKDIAHKFTFENITTSAGLQWTSAGISRLLSSPVYAGHSLYGKTRQKNVNGKRKTEKTAENEQILIENTHEPIVPQELWDKVQQIKKERNSRPASLKLAKHKFSGLIRCALCEGTHSFQTSKFNRKRITSCQTRIYNDQLETYTICKNQGCNLDDFEKLFYSYLDKYADRLEEYTHLIKAAGSSNAINHKQEIKNMQKTMQKLKQSIKRVQQGFITEIFTREEAYLQVKKFKEHIKMLEDRTEELRNKEGMSELDYMERTLAKMKRFLGNQDMLTEREANDILKDFVEVIYYKKTDQGMELQVMMKEEG